MEQRGTAATPLADLDDLRDLVGWPGPFVTSYLAFEPATEALAREVEIRWQAQRRRLSAAGADDAHLDVVDAALAGAHRGGGAGLAAVVPASGDPLVERLRSAPPEGAAFGRVPALRPLIDLRQRHVAHVVALVDRTGADLRARRAGEVVGEEIGTSVAGEDTPVRKVAPGGWSQRRFQQRAEDSWHHNMAQVAPVVAGLADRVGAAVVAVGGDERAVTLLAEALPDRVRARVHRIAVTRAADGSGDRLDDEVAAELSGWVAGRVGEVLALLAEELGQHDRAAAGAAPTFEALRAGRVAVLLVDGGGPVDAPGGAWVGSTLQQVATAPGDLAAPGDATAAPACDAAVAAALATGADVVAVPRDDQGALPPSLPDGVGALLRW